MLPLPSFEIIKARDLASLQEALAKADHKTKIMAGGTDLIPNLKHRLYDVEKIISIKNVPDFKNIEFSKDEKLSIGAGVLLRELEQSERIKSHVPVLALAATKIASPQIRRMATVGGNICLDTRCLYFNQSEFWRSALGFCLKKDGDCCHVVKTGKRCVAASSNDLATVLLVYKAQVEILSGDLVKTVALDDFYTANGEKNNILKPFELLTKVNIYLKPNLKTGFYKLRHREQIDFSMLSLALGYELCEEKIFDLQVVVNAMVAKPRVFSLKEYDGYRIDEILIDDIAQLVAKKSHPQTNICDDPKWRKEIIGEGIKQCFRQSQA